MCESKTCSKCGQTKSTTEFNKSRRSKDGLQSQCRACSNAANKAWHAANKERHSAAGKAWYENNKDRVTAASKAWYEANRERKAATSKAWYENNRERHSATCKAWEQAHPEHKQARNSKRRATEAGIEGPHFTAEEWKQKLGACNHKCHYCGKQDDRLTVDHVIPLSDPGSSNTIENVVPCCAGCNRRKHDKPVDVFLAELKSCQGDRPTNPAQEVN